MKRFHDWQLRLEAFSRERRNVPFRWGANDCALFAADCVEALTGERLLVGLRGYDGRGAVRLLQEMGGLHGIATQALGAPIAPAFATVGDVVLVRMADSEALGICNGGVVIGPGPRGIEVSGMDAALAAWRV
jgi:hypothetical protein